MPNLLTMHPSHGHDMTIVNGISRIGWMTGGKAALWKDQDMADLFTSKAVTFIEQNRNTPFSLYLATHDLHVPRVRTRASPARRESARAATRSSKGTGASAGFSRRSIA